MVKKIVYILIVFISCFFFLFCSEKKEENINIESIADNAIQQYDSTDFSQYFNLEILVRERRFLSDAIYVSAVSYGKDSINPMGSWDGFLYKYKVFDIVSISEKFSEFRKYISDDSLKLLIKNFSNLNLEYLKVDKYKNVFLSPSSFSFEQAFLLKINDSTRVRDSKKIRIPGDGTFIHYKRDWYVSEFYIDKYNSKLNRFSLMSPLLPQACSLWFACKANFFSNQNTIQQSFFAGIINGAIVNILFRAKNQPFFHPIPVFVISTYIV